MIQFTRLHFPDESLSDSIPQVAATFRATGHAGLIYKDGQDRFFLHLGWHNSLRREMPTADDAWASPSYLDEERGMVVAGRCREIWRWFQRTRTLPYSLNYSPGSARFRAADGSLSLCDGINGVTCATFVLAVFESCGIDLINTNDWRARDEDRTKQEEFVAIMQSQLDRDLKDNTQRPTTPSQAHIDAVQREIGCFRFRPEEVVASCLCADPNAAMCPCEGGGKIVALALTHFIQRRNAPPRPPVQRDSTQSLNSDERLGLWKFLAVTSAPILLALLLLYAAHLLLGTNEPPEKSIPAKPATTPVEPAPPATMRLSK